MIGHLLNQECFIVKVERDSYGDVVETDPIKVDCRAYESFEIIKNQAGEDVVSSIRFWIPSEIDIDDESITKTQIKHKNKDYSIISVRNRFDTLGKSIFKVVSV